MAKLTQFRFPLSFLRIIPEIHRPKGSGHHRKATLQDTQPLAQSIIRFAYMNMGHDQWEAQVAAMMAQGYERDAAIEMIQDLRYGVAAMKTNGDLPFYFQSLREAVQSVYGAMGLHDTGTGQANIPDSKFNRQYEEFQQIRAQVGPGDMWVSVHQGIVWDLNGGQWGWDLFAVYCAILSKISNKRTPWVVHYDEIQARTEGYLSAKSLPKGLKPLLTIDKIRYRTKTLKAKGLIDYHSEPHTRERLYWLPGLCTNPEFHIAKRLAKKAAAKDQSPRQERITALAQAMIQQPTQQRRSSSDPLPKQETPRSTLSPAPPTGSTPTIAADIDGRFRDDRGYWYTREYLEQSHRGDGEHGRELIELLTTKYEQREHEGVTYYSGSHPRDREAVSR